MAQNVYIYNYIVKHAQRRFLLKSELFQKTRVTKEI